MPLRHLGETTQIADAAGYLMRTLSALQKNSGDLGRCWVSLPVHGWGSGVAGDAKIAPQAELELWANSQHRCAIE